MSPTKKVAPGGEAGGGSQWLSSNNNPFSVTSTHDDRESLHERVYGRQLTLGEVVREEGVARAEAGTEDAWRDCADRGITELAGRGVVFQAADLLDVGVPEPDHANRWGPRLLAAARAGLIVPIGYGPSKRPTTACSAVRLWRGAVDDDRDGGLR